MKLINDFSFSLFLWQIILFLIITAIGYGQNAQSVLISNNQGFDKSVFADIDLKENETHYSLKVKNISLNRYDFPSLARESFRVLDKNVFC